MQEVSGGVGDPLLACGHPFFIQQVGGFLAKIDEADQVSDRPAEVMADDAEESCFYPVGLVELGVDPGKILVGFFADNALPVEQDPDGTDEQQTGDEPVFKAALAGDLQAVDPVLLIGQSLDVLLFLLFP